MDFYLSEDEKFKVYRLRIIRISFYEELFT